MMPFSLLRTRCGKNVAVLLSIAACAIVVATQARTLTQRTDEQGLATELGLESAWPHVRVDFSR